MHQDVSTDYKSKKFYKSGGKTVSLSYGYLTLLSDEKKKRMFPKWFFKKGQ